ncbi:MAG TPA: branched-chain amino acid ABC transporter permease [Abditibacteriaceae bacterium]
MSFSQAMRLWPVRVIFAALAVLALLALQNALGRTMNPYNYSILVLAGISVILAVSLNLINGITGQFSLGHAGFMAIGAYTSASFTYYAGPGIIARSQNAEVGTAFVFFIALLIAAFFAGIAGLLVGMPSLRLRGDYLAIVTLGFGQIIITIIRTIKEVGDASGFTNLPKMTTLAWVYGAAILCIFCVRNIADSAIGRSMRAVREDEIAAEAAGIDTTKIKVLAFVIGSMWAGVAGALQAHYLQLASPDMFTFYKSIEIVVMVVLGGLGSITGAAIAAVLLRFLEESLRDVGPALAAGIGLAVLAAILSRPRHRAAIQAGPLGTIRWLMWPVLSIIGMLLVYRYGQGWMQSNVSALRYIIYASILIVLMLLRPQGLLGRGEFGWHLFKKRQNQNENSANGQNAA